MTFVEDTTAARRSAPPRDTGDAFLSPAYTLASTVYSSVGTFTDSVMSVLFVFSKHGLFSVGGSSWLDRGDGGGGLRRNELFPWLSIYVIVRVTLGRSGQYALVTQATNRIAG